MLVQAQNNSNEANYTPVYIDQEGVMRWTNNKSEVALFGVNYTVPFAHAYRAHKNLGISHELAIDQDVYHMARLGFNAFRVHAWDCEISDTLGNLLNNEHLRLFDYMLNKMKERGIKIILTPLAYWGNGYPERSEDTPGFSTKYGKADCLTNPDAIKAQENYLSQFVNHVNSYTNLAYKDDPDIIAFEICNEPHHSGTPNEVTEFINKTVTSVKNTGCRKLVFYNVSHNIELANAYYNADISGGTFQWYPTNLVHGFEIKGNFLPNVSSYNIPFDTLENYKKTAKIIYEFDAADIGRSYIYPYIVKSFREAGMQFITHFSYDPLYMAYANTEYVTHYMNLAYAPQKALSLMIAGEVCKNVGIHEKFEGYPNDTIFGEFKVSYKNDLAEMVSNEKFIYTNHTQSIPPNLKKLKQIAGFGNSKLVKYDGTGAYFLDKIKDGVWRLEIMPDAQWVRDPFERASPKKEVTVIRWKSRNIEIDLPDLSADFKVMGINSENNVNEIAKGKSFIIKPGTYLVMNQKTKYIYNPEEKLGAFQINEFVAPETTCENTYLIHEPAYEIVSEKNHSVMAKVVSNKEIDSVCLYVYGRKWSPEILKMNKTAAYTYSTTINHELFREGFLEYNITVFSNQEQVTYPEKLNSVPSDWDYYGKEKYKTRVVKSTDFITLFDAREDGNRVYSNTRFQNVISPFSGEEAVSISNGKFTDEFPEYAFRFYFKDKIKGRLENLLQCNKLVIKGFSLNEELCPLQIALVLDDGSVYAANITLKSNGQDQEVLLNKFTKVPHLKLPNAYPVFIERYFNGCENCAFDLDKAESVQFSIGPGLNKKDAENHIVVFEKVILK